MGALLQAVAGQLLRALVNAQNAGSNTEDLQVAIINLHTLLGDLARGVIWVLAQVWGAKQYEYPLASQVGKDLEEVVSNTDNAISHVAFTILPNSLNYLQGYVFSHGIIPLRQALAKSVHDIGFLMGWRGQIMFWRKHTVDPTVKQWRAFESFWRTWPLSILSLWRDWLAHPLKFGKWADAPIAATLPPYLAQRSARGDLQALNDVILSSWVTDPLAVQDAVNRWLLAPGG